MSFLIVACQNKITLPSGMVYIPKGHFEMGAKSVASYENEYPKHTVSIDAFLMDVTEVTNAQFLRFVNATQYVTLAERPFELDSVQNAGSLVFKSTERPVNLDHYWLWWTWVEGANWKQPEGKGSSIDDRMDHPVIHIAYEDALAYAQWANKRLPTEAEWEWAAMGGLDNSPYPWGNTAIATAADKANFWQGVFPFHNLLSDGYAKTAPVKNYPSNGYGLFDMAGNVWEICADRYHFNSYRMDAEKGLVKNPKGPAQSFDPYQNDGTEKYVIRGGSFLCSASYCSGYRTSRRMSVSYDSSSSHVGFRCVKDL